ncbi:MAG: 16S rRNA (adenine(1518)-N(6)/adenine(1519)-N(6))-dimethyltransferase RsmA [Candidatus Uhrbacteria bacterium]
MFAKKSFGQHWLKSQAIVNKIVEAADLKPSDCVLEIGPGKGVLTQALLAKTKNVTAVEADRDLIPGLQKKFGQDLNLIEGDVIKIANKELVAAGDKRYKLVANLPYNITSATLSKFLIEEPRPSCLVVMVQREVADRITAQPGDMGLLSVVCQLHAKIQKICQVKPGSFSPPPKVQSTVLRFDLITPSKNRLREVELEAVIRLAKAGFSSRRKQLHRNLADQRIVSSEKTKQVLAKLKLSDTARAQELSIENWLAFYRAISKLK